MGKINTLLAKEKGIGDKEIYNELSKKYKYFLEYYINSIIDLSKYDNEIKNSNLYIGINPKYKRLNEYLDLDYIFLINNLFIEKLSINDLNLLKESNKDDINDSIINMIKNTYKEIINDNYHRGEYTDKIYNVCYGPFVPYNFVKNNNLVFKIYYGKNLIDVHKMEYYKLRSNQTKFFNDLMDVIKKEVKEKLNIECDILIEKDIY